MNSVFEKLPGVLERFFDKNKKTETSRHKSFIQLLPFQTVRVKFGKPQKKCFYTAHCHKRIIMTENRILLLKSREVLQGKWGVAIGSFLIYSLIATSIGSMGGIGPMLALILAGPLSLGAANFSLAIAAKKDANVELIFEGFKRFITALTAYLLMIILVLVWAMLLIIPGIIALLSYSMTFFILSDQPLINATDALNRSKKIMKGDKLKLFYLYLRFLLLTLLCILTLGIGFLWLIPYMHVTMAMFYDDIKVPSSIIN